MIRWLLNLISGETRRPDTNKTRNEAWRENLHETIADFNESTILNMAKSKRTRRVTRSEAALIPARRA